MGGQGRRLLAQLGGDVVLRVEILELLVVVRPGLEVMNVAGELVRQAFDVVDDRREDLQYQEHHQRQGEQVDEHNRQHLRHQALSGPRPLDEPDGRVERQRKEDRRRDPLQRGPGVEQRDRKEDRQPGPEERHQHDLGDRPRLDLVRAHRGSTLRPLGTSPCATLP
jgi:hypothetical protein